MSLTIDASQVGTLIANPSSISGYSSSGPIIISGAITFSQANSLNAVDATYIQATISETTVTNLSGIAVNNSSRASLNKFSMVVSDTSATAAELNAVQALTSVAVDASNITGIEASDAAAITTLYTSSVSGLGNETISVNDTTINATTLNTIDGYSTGAITATSTTIEGPAADINTALSSAITHEADIAVTVTDTTVAASDLNAIEGLTTGVTSVSSATRMTGSFADVDEAFGHNDDALAAVSGVVPPNRINGLDNINVTLTDDPTTAQIVLVIAQTGTGKVTATTDATEVNLSDYSAISGTGHVLTIPTLVDDSLAAADLKTLDAATTETITLDPTTATLASPTISSSSYADVLSVLSSSGISGLGSAAVTVSGTITVAEANDINALTDGAITATISTTDVSTLKTLTANSGSTANAYTIEVTTASANASDLNTIDALTSVAVVVTDVTTVTGTLSDTHTLYENKANFTGLGSEAVTVTSTTIDANLLTELNADTDQLITFSNTITAMTGDAAQIHTLLDLNTTGAEITGIDLTGTFTLSGDSTNNVIVATDLNSIDALVSSVVQIDSSAVTLQGAYADVEDALTASKLVADATADTTGVETVTIASLEGLAIELTGTTALADYQDIQNNYTTGVITATISDEIADYIATDALVAGNALALTVTDATIDAEDLVTLASLTTGAITVNAAANAASTINGTVSDATAIFSNSSISGLADATVNLDAAGTAAAADLKTIADSFTGGGTGDLDIANIARITGSITDINAVLSDGEINNKGTQNVTVTDLTVAATELSTLITDVAGNSNLTTGNVDIISSSIAGTAAQVAAVIDTAANGGEAALFTASGTDGVVSGLAAINVTLDNLATAGTQSTAVADIESIAGMTTGVVTATVTETGASAIAAALTETIDASTGFAGHNLTMTIADTEISASDLATLETLTQGSITLSATGGPLITGSASDVTSILSGTKTSGFSTSDVTITGGLSVTQLNSITDITSGTVTATITDTDAATLAGITVTGNALTLSVTDASVAATTITALDAKTTGQVNVSSVNTITGTYAEVDAVLDATGVTGRGTVNATVSDSTTVANAKLISDKTTGAISATITETNLDALLGGGILTTTNDSGTDADRTPGTYTIGKGDYSVQTGGTDATFTIVIGTGGTVDSITVDNPGNNFVANETITVANANLGNGDDGAGNAAADLTFDVETASDGLEASNNWTVTVASQSPENSSASTSQLDEVISAANLNTLNGLTDEVVTVTAPTIDGSLADITTAFTANTPPSGTAATISGLETKAVTITDATGITLSEAQTAQGLTSGVVTATIEARDALTLTTGSLNEGTNVNGLNTTVNTSLAVDTTGGLSAGQGGNGALVFSNNAAKVTAGATAFLDSAITITHSDGTTAASATGLEITINAADDGTYTVAAIDDPGQNFEEGDIITIAKASLDNGANATDLTLVVQSGGLTNTRTADTYSGVAHASTNGTGADATFDVVVAADGSITSIALASGGGGYTAAEVVTIDGSVIGGTTSTGDITIPIATVGGNDIADFINETVAGTTDLSSGDALSVTFEDNTVAAADLLAANNLTTGLITLTAANGGETTITGSLTNLNAVYAAAVTEGNGILTSSFSAAPITIQELETFGGLVSAADLNTLNESTTGVITIDAAWDAAGDGGTEETTITGITGTYSDVHDALTQDKTQANTSDTTGVATPTLVIPDDLTVTLTGTSTVAQVNDIAGYNTGVVTATISDTDMDTLDDLFGATSSVAAVDTLSASAAADGSRADDTYTGVTTTSSGSGSGLTLDIVVGSTATTVVTLADITINNAGIGYADDEVITIDGAKLGGGADITIAVNGLAASTAHAYAITVDDASVAATNLNTLNDKTSGLITVTSSTLTGARTDVDTALGTATTAITGLASINATLSDTVSVDQANTTAALTTGVITATLTTGLLTSFSGLNETGNAYTVNVSDTGSVDAATVNVLNGKTTGVVDLSATSITGALSDIKTLYDANTAETVSGLGNESITISDTGTVSASTINDLNGLTTGVIRLNTATTVSGSLSELTTLYDANSAGTVTGLGNEALQVTGSVTSSELATLNGFTTGTVSVSTSATSIAASTLNTLDSESTTVVDASTITTITGNAADINTAYASSGISGLGNEAVTLTDTSLAASTLTTLDDNTSGAVDASTVTTITGSAADVNTVYSAAGISGTGNEAVTITDTSIDATVLNTLDGNTTGSVNASSLTTITGTGTNAQTAFDSAGISGLTFDASSYLASYTDLLDAYGSDLTLARAHYFAFGSAEGRSFDSFDDASYLASYSDLLTAYGTNTDSALIHYINHGYSEGRAADSFDENSYLASNPTLIGTVTDAAAHYVSTGYASGLSLDTFDEFGYIASYSDLITAFGADGDAATKHFVDLGSAEGRTDTFDDLGYIASHADLITAYGTDTSSAALHYISYGSTEGRTVTFDASSYLAAHADLRAAYGTDQELAKQHYILHGSAEGRVTA